MKGQRDISGRLPWRWPVTCAMRLKYPLMASVKSLPDNGALRSPSLRWSASIKNWPLPAGLVTNIWPIWCDTASALMWMKHHGLAGNSRNGSGHSLIPNAHFLTQILRLASVPQMRLPAALKWLWRRQEAERVQLYEHTAHPLQQSRCGIIANPLWFEKQTFFVFRSFTFLEIIFHCNSCCIILTFNHLRRGFVFQTQILGLMG